MNKVIKLGKRWYNSRLKYNNIHAINDALALAKGMSVLGIIPKRKCLRQYIMQQSTGRAGLIAMVSHKDIKRMEQANKCEIPVNIVDILEIIMENIILEKSQIEYRAKDDAIVSVHTIGHTIAFLKFVMGHMRDEQGVILPEFAKYTIEIAHVDRRLREFDEQYPDAFNSIFN